MNAAQESGVLMDRLSNRVLGALYRGGVFTLEDLCACPEEHVRCIVDVGKKAMSELRSFLRSMGRGFAPPRDWTGCGCPPCAFHEAAFQRMKAAGPLPPNVLPFRPRGTEEAGA